MNEVKILIAILFAAFSATTRADPVPAEFTYQGVLELNNAPLNSNADIVVRLYNGASLIGSSSHASVPVSHGLFKLDLTFDPALFDGTGYQLEFLVRSPPGTGSYTTLTPRQPLKTTPYAYHANSADTLTAPAVIAADVPAALLSVEQANTSAYTIPSFRATRGTTNNAADAFIDRVVEVESADTAIGILSITDQFPVAGVLGSTAAPFGAAIIGEIEPGAIGEKYALWGLNLANATEVRLATSTFAADLIGDLRVSGRIIRQFAPFSYDLATPIAYGFINFDGSTASGTPNFASVYNAILQRYEIELDNETYNGTGYVTIVTPASATVVPRTGASSGRLSVYLANPVGSQLTRSSFQFVTYKPNGAALVRGQPRRQIMPLTTPYTDEQLNPNPAPLPARIPVLSEPTTQSPIQHD